MLLAAGALLAACLRASPLAVRVRVPSVLLFLGLGMLIGTDGLGWVEYNSYRPVRTIGIVALALFLFEGGLTSGLLHVRPGAPGMGLRRSRTRRSSSRVAAPDARDVFCATATTMAGAATPAHRRRPRSQNAVSDATPFGGHQATGHLHL